MAKDSIAAPSAPKAGGSNKVRSIEARPSANNGFIVDHSFENNGPGYKSPESHVFTNHREAAKHITKALRGIKKARSSGRKFGR